MAQTGATVTRARLVEALGLSIVEWLESLPLEHQG